MKVTSDAERLAASEKNKRGFCKQQVCGISYDVTIPAKGWNSQAPLKNMDVVHCHDEFNELGLSNSEI